MEPSLFRLGGCSINSGQSFAGNIWQPMACSMGRPGDPRWRTCATCVTAPAPGSGPVNHQSNLRYRQLFAPRRRFGKLPIAQSNRRDCNSLGSGYKHASSLALPAESLQELQNPGRFGLQMLQPRPRLIYSPSLWNNQEDRSFKRCNICFPTGHAVANHGLIIRVVLFGLPSGNFKNNYPKWNSGT